MKIDSVKDDIKLIKEHFKLVLIDVQQDFGVDYISWPNYISGISKKLYAKEYEFLKSKRQYSFLLENKGLIQLNYNYKDNILKKVRLAYYPYPIKVKEDYNELDEYYVNSDDVTVGEFYYDLGVIANATVGITNGSSLAEEEVNYKDVGKSELDVLEENFNLKYLLTNTSHIRFDYDHDVKSHNKFEIQYSSINSIRIPSNKLLSPFLFMDFIVRNEFPESYKIISKKKSYKTAYSICYKKSYKVSQFMYDNFHLHHD